MESNQYGQKNKKQRHSKKRKEIRKLQYYSKGDLAGSGRKTTGYFNRLQKKDMV